LTDGARSPSLRTILDAVRPLGGNGFSRVGMYDEGTRSPDSTRWAPQRRGLRAANENGFERRQPKWRQKRGGP
jgi:hypothetical protein